MIEVRDLTKRYADKLAVAGISFRVEKGEVVGFLGPNGAGKSTTMRIVAGFLGMTSGTVTVMGRDIESEPILARRAIGYMPETVPLYPEMRVAEYLRFRSELKGVPRGVRAEYVESAMARAAVLDSASRTIGRLSKGYRQRVGLADALVAKPPVLILDEPTAGLDPNQIRETRDLIRELGQDHAVLVSTHLLTEAEASCNRVIVIASGKIVFEGGAVDIARASSLASLSLVIRGDLARARAVISQIPFRKPVSVESSSIEPSVHQVQIQLTMASSDPAVSEYIETLVASLAKESLLVREISVRKSSLEKVFAELTQTKATPTGDAAGEVKESE